CRDNRSVLYQRVPRLFEELALARGDGRHARLLRSLGRADLLVLDDWGLEPLDAAARHDLLEILEERYGRRSTMITSQLPVDRWHEIIGDPTYADAILDRLVHNAHRVELAGESMRRTHGKKPERKNPGRLDQPRPMPSIVAAIQRFTGCWTPRWTSATMRPVLRSYQARLSASVATPSCTTRLPDRSSGSTSPRFSRHSRISAASSGLIIIRASEPPMKSRRLTAFFAAVSKPINPPKASPNNKRIVVR